ncbi:MAG: hypothetical protein HYY37_03025 [Candidatus Aenigmarchaeota archaeon]|nr:hypothetical protein [Candidatus Aenigmarchaeota archaeon]
MKLVVKIGGSLAIADDGPRVPYFKKLVPVLKRLHEHQLIVSIGGGAFVRNYYRILQQLGMKNEEMELVAIELLRANVRFLSLLVGKKPLFALGDITPSTSGVIGGIAPGRSTDANAAYAAVAIKADYFIKLTNVDGVYDKDPNTFTHAKKIPFIPFGELRAYAKKGMPGDYGILDPLAIDLIAKHRIRTVIMNGKEPKALLDVLEGKEKGTLIG